MDILQTTFSRGSLKNFLMSSSESLGVLKSLVIWHDNSGKEPDWFLDKVTVKDMSTGIK